MNSHHWPLTITRLTCLLLFINLCIISNFALAWKPTTHVFLVKQAIEEAIFDETLDKWMMPIYRVDYQNQQKQELLGHFEADQALISQLQNNRDELYAGVIGPDGYPDMPTGQTRIHVACPDGAERLDNAAITCPVPPHGHGNGGEHNILESSEIHKHLVSNDWLQYIWDEAEKNGSDKVKSFAFGYLTHAAGDMFMHTFVNKYAGGPFSSFSDNGLRHFLIESYVGKRTPDLSDDDFDIKLSPQLDNFIYSTLVDAHVNSKLHKDLLVEFPLSYTVNNIYTVVSIPRHFSSLKNFLLTRINNYETTLADLNEDIQVLGEKLNECIERAINIDIREHCPAQDIVNLVKDEGIKLTAKNLLVISSSIIIQYYRNWAADIERGLKAWPTFSHQVAKNMLFSPSGMDKLALTNAWEDYRNEYFIDMLGAPDAVGDILAAVNRVQNELYTPTTRARIELVKDNFYDLVVQTISFGTLTFEDLEDFINNPELHINTVVASPISKPENRPVPINLTSLNLELRIDDTGFTKDQNGNYKRFDENLFPPAYNTIMMVKLMLLNENGLSQLYKTLVCIDPEDCDLSLSVNTSNAMLGFIRTLDGENEWKNHNSKMAFAECNVYQQIFMYQQGETEEVDQNCVRIIDNNNIALTQLDVPDFFPTDENYDAPFEVTMSHSESDVKIYYTVSELDNPRTPSDNPDDSFSRLYTNSFIQFSPLDIARPLIIRAVAYKNGFRHSDVIEQQFIIDAVITKPTFFPQLLDHNGPVNVSISAETDSTVFYTLNGSKPDYTSTRYNGSLILNVGQYDIRAIAYRLGYPASEIGAKQYNVWSGDGDNMEIPQFTPAGSAGLTPEVEISIKTDSQNANIYYTLVESGLYQEPTTNDIKYTGPFKPGIGNWFITAKTFDPSGSKGPSIAEPIHFEVTEASGDTDLPIITPNGGIYYNPLTIQISGETTPENTGSPQIFYTKNGDEPYAPPVGTGRNKKLKLFRPTTFKVQARQTGFNPSPVATARFDFYAANPSFLPLAGDFENLVEVTLSSITDFAKIYYTLDGTEPSEESSLYETTILLTDTTMIKAKAFKNSFYDSETMVAIYKIKQFVAPEIISQPQSDALYVGQNIVLTGDATAYPLPDYQWYKNDIEITGETSKTLLIENSQIQNTADYHFEASNIVSTTLSDIASIDVSALPPLVTITQQPMSVELEKGETLALTVSIDSTVLPVQYLWYHNNEPLLSQSSNELTIENVATQNAGEYKVAITNITGNVFSDTITVDVIDTTIYTQPAGADFPPNIVLQPQAQTLKQGETISLIVVADAIPNASYLWMVEQRLLPEQNSSNLTIENASIDDSGNYRVIIRNALGTVVSDQVNITVSAIDDTNDMGQVDDKKEDEKADEKEENTTQDPPVNNQPDDKSTDASTQNSKKSSSGALQLEMMIALFLLFSCLRVFSHKSNRFTKLRKINN